MQTDKIARLRELERAEHAALSSCNMNREDAARAVERAMVAREMNFPHLLAIAEAAKKVDHNINCEKCKAGVYYPDAAKELRSALTAFEEAQQ